MSDKLTARIEPLFTFCTCKHEAMLWHTTCTKITMPVTFKIGFYLQKTVFYGENSDFLIFESLLKMSRHGRHIIAYTSRIYTMQYAYHICNGIDPTVISISLFWAPICLTKILSRGVVHMVFVRERSGSVVERLTRDREAASSSLTSVKCCIVVFEEDTFILA